MDRFVTFHFAERRRIERALHDGAEQDLVAVSVRLQLLRGLLEREDALALLDEIRREVSDALDGLRTLAVDVYPSILEARGLADAIRAYGRASTLRARVNASGERFPLEVEAAAYFACRALLEPLDARTEVVISVRHERDALELEIAGVGANDSARDLVAAAGGSLTSDGARVVARFPLGRQSSAAR